MYRTLRCQHNVHHGDGRSKLCKDQQIVSQVRPSVLIVSSFEAPVVLTDPRVMQIWHCSWIRHATRISEARDERV